MWYKIVSSSNKKDIGKFTERLEKNQKGIEVPQIVLVDICLSDYYRGHHLPTIYIPMYGRTTYKELWEEIKSEISLCWDMYESVYSEEEIDNAIELFYKLEVKGRTKETFWKPEEKLQDADDPVIAHFVIGHVERNGFFEYVVWRDEEE